MIEVSKKQLAELLGVSQPMVSKHVRSGLLDDCFTECGKRIILKKALDKIYHKQRKVTDYKAKYNDLLKSLEKMSAEIEALKQGHSLLR